MVGLVGLVGLAAAALAGTVGPADLAHQGAGGGAARGTAGGAADDPAWSQAARRACAGAVTPPTLPDDAKNLPEPPAKEVMRVGAARVRWQGNFLLASTTLPMQTQDRPPDDVLAISQPDYGQVRDVQPDRAGGLVVLGDQVSYRVQVTLQDGRARFGPRVTFPTLWARPCGLLQRWAGQCQPSRAFYSPALQAALMEGYDRSGRHRVTAVGLPPAGAARWLQARDTDRDTGWRVLGEVPQERGVILVSARHARVFHDGDRHVLCAPP